MAATKALKTASKAAKSAAPAKAQKTRARKPAEVKPAVKSALATKVKPVAVQTKAAAPVLASAAKASVSKPQPAAPAAAPKKLDFKAGDFIVYPAHGVGKIVAIETQQIAGMTLDLYVVSFEKDKMTVRVPTAKAKASGMRKLSSPETVQNALVTLKGRARIKRTMWSRRAQEYEAKINSGDLISIAEVVRDLHRASGQPEQSYSERQLYEAALDRMARELAAVERIDEKQAIERLEGALRKAA